MADSLFIDGLGLRYESGVEVGPVSLELKSGEVTLIAGASGAGKSTLARMATGLLSQRLGIVAWAATL